MEKNAKHSVLVVDDDPQIFKIVSRILNPNRYEVEKAQDGEEALKKISKYKPVLLLLDLMMPGMSGIEVCQKIKGSPGSKEIMILVLTAKDGQIDRRRCFESGADDFLVKPFHIDSLARKIEYMIGKKGFALN
ncbi:MAG: response regulator [Deltaproteobacteria bacterium]|nr:response regulator [Deltaproteobacteria bacterium]